MSNKRPANGPNLKERRSNLVSKNNGWKAQLVQGEKEQARKQVLREQDDAALRAKVEQKRQFRREAHELDVSLGLAVKKEGPLPEWKLHKLFLAEYFAPPVVCRKYNGHFVFRNKLSMQQYLQREVMAEEWEGNEQLLRELRLSLSASSVDEGAADIASNASTCIEPQTPIVAMAEEAT
jgi:hypothetical protein